MATPMEIKKNEILLIYDSTDMRDKEARVYLNAFRDYKIKEVDINKDPLTESQFAELSQKIGVHPSELMDKQSDVYKNSYQESELSEEDIFKVLRKNPELLKTPIAVYHDRAEIVGDPHGFIKDNMASKDITLNDDLRQQESG